MPGCQHVSQRFAPDTYLQSGTSAGNTKGHGSTKPDVWVVTLRQ